MDPVVTPGRILLGRSKGEFNDLLHNPRPPKGLPTSPVVPVPGDELAMPTKDGIRSHDASELLKHLSPEDFAFDRERRR